MNIVAGPGVGGVHYMYGLRYHTRRAQLRLHNQPMQPTASDLRFSV